MLEVVPSPLAVCLNKGWFPFENTLVLSEKSLKLIHYRGPPAADEGGFDPTGFVYVQLQQQISEATGTRREQNFHLRDQQLLASTCWKTVTLLLIWTVCFWPAGKWKTNNNST